MYAVIKDRLQMNTIFSGHLFLIDKNSQRVMIIKKCLEDLNNTIFFNEFSSVEEALNLVLTTGILAPDYIYIHESLANFEAKNVLKKFRSIYKTKAVKIVIFGNVISQGLVAASVKYNFRVIQTNPETELNDCSLFDGTFVKRNKKDTDPTILQTA